MGLDFVHCLVSRNAKEEHKFRPQLQRWEATNDLVLLDSSQSLNTAQRKVSVSLGTASRFYLETETNPVSEMLHLYF